MSAHVLNAKHQSNSSAQAALKVTAQWWFVVAFAGQLLFAYYVLAYYGGAAIAGNWAKWNQVLNTATWRAMLRAISRWASIFFWRLW